MSRPRLQCRDVRDAPDGLVFTADTVGNLSSIVLFLDLNKISYVSSSSEMAPFYAGNSCIPFTPISSPCTLGNYVDFAINVSEPADIAQGVAFATKYNVRLVIRNTGHEYVTRLDSFPYQIANRE